MKRGCSITYVFLSPVFGYLDFIGWILNIIVWEPDKNSHTYCHLTLKPAHYKKKPPVASSLVKSVTL